MAGGGFVWFLFFPLDRPQRVWPSLPNGVGAEPACPHGSGSTLRGTGPRPSRFRRARRRRASASPRAGTRRDRARDLNVTEIAFLLTQRIAALEWTRAGVQKLGFVFAAHLRSRVHVKQRFSELEPGTLPDGR